MNNKEKLQSSKIQRLNEINYNKYGTPMKIIEYKNSKNITIEFQDEHKTIIKNREYKEFLKGTISNPYDKSVYNIGYMGEGKYKTKINKKQEKSYDIWVKMLQRCYDPYYLNKYPTYIDCYVCEEWHNFQNFAKWWEENVYNCNNERLELDKDILVKGNKIYSPKTCLIVPQRINSLFVKSNIKRGKYPIGVSNYNNKCLRSYCHTLERQEHLGYFSINRPFQAFYTYKVFKENYIKQVADEYKDLIPKELYEALYRYQVEIND